MKQLPLRFPICLLIVVSSHSLFSFAQQTSSSNAIPSASNREDAAELAKHVMTTADLAIKASDRTLSILMWALGICLGGSAIGIAGVWMWLLRFTRKIQGEISHSQADASKLLESAENTASLFEQIFCSLPLLFVDGVDETSRVVALSTLAQLRRSELAPIFGAMLRKSNDTKIKAACVYALGLLEMTATSWTGDIIYVSNNPDFNLRRECARALSAIGPLNREIRMRLEEMTKDADDLVKEYARRGIENAK